MGGSEVVSRRKIDMIPDKSGPLGAVGEQIGAGNGTRTRDIKLGKLALYQLSYARSKRTERGEI